MNGTEASFYLAAFVAIGATVRVISGLNAVHALLYLIVSLLAIAITFFLLGAPFAAALEVIVYAGAILVLVVFVIMMLNLGETAVGRERAWLTPRTWIGPAVLAVILLSELTYILAGLPTGNGGSRLIEAKQVGVVLFGPYLIAVELASLLLLAGLVGAWHLSRRAGTESADG